MTVVWANCTPPEDMLVPVKVTLFEKMVFVDVIKGALRSGQ